MLEFISDFSEEILAPDDVLLGLHPTGFHSVNDAEYSSTSLSLRNDHLDGVSRCTVYSAYLRNCLDGVEDVYGEAFFYEYDEAMSAGELCGVPYRYVNQRLFVTDVPDQGLSRRFTKGQAESHRRIGADNCLVEILYSLDEVGLAENKVHLGGLFNGDAQELHPFFLAVHRSRYHFSGPKIKPFPRPREAAVFQQNDKIWHIFSLLGTGKRRKKFACLMNDFLVSLIAKQQYTVFAPRGEREFPERGGVATLLRCSCRCNPRVPFSIEHPRGLSSQA